MESLIRYVAGLWWNVQVLGNSFGRRDKAVININNTENLTRIGFHTFSMSSMWAWAFFLRTYNRGHTCLAF